MCSPYLFILSIFVILAQSCHCRLMKHSWKMMVTTAPRVYQLNPLVINKRITTAFQPENVRNTSYLQDLKSYLTRHVESMNEVNVITLLHRCAKHKKDVYSLLPIDEIIRLLDTGRPTSQGAHL